jgi:hypothetical protein
MMIEKSNRRIVAVMFRWLEKTIPSVARSKTGKHD